MCAHYTALAATTRPVRAELELLLRTNEYVEVASAPGNFATMRGGQRTLDNGLRRQALGRHAVMELATRYVPEAQRAAARTLNEEGAWMMFVPMRVTDETRRIATRLYKLPDLPQWGPSPVLACLLGAPPATLIEGSAHVAFVAADGVRAAARELDATPALADYHGADRAWRDFVQATAACGEALGVHWAYR
jgi:hypothetical protein